MVETLEQGDRQIVRQQQQRDLGDRQEQADAHDQGGEPMAFRVTYAPSPPRATRSTRPSTPGWPSSSRSSAQRHGSIICGHERA